MLQPGLWRARMAAVLGGVAVVAGLVVAAPAAPVVASPAGQASAGGASADEAHLLTLANGLRASVGANPLSLDDSLSAIARTWAGSMAAAGTISHNPALTTSVTGWLKLAENVGMGPSIDNVHQALVASHPHYVNLTDTEVTAVGIGVVTSGQYVFVVEDFEQRAPAGATVVTSPPSTTAARATPTTPTTAAAAPPRATTATTTATVAPVAPVPAAATAPPPPVPGDPSPWLTLALELTRGWERTSG